MKVNDENEFDRCPVCIERESKMTPEQLAEQKEADGKYHTRGNLGIIEDWTNMHTRETLLHCWDCDSKFIIYYEFMKMVRLDETVIKRAPGPYYSFDPCELGSGSIGFDPNNTDYTIAPGDPILPRTGSFGWSGHKIKSANSANIGEAKEEVEEDE